MKFDTDTALNFFAIAARATEKHATRLKLVEADELEILLGLSVTVGEAIKSHVEGDATQFRRALLGLVSIAAIAEQWTVTPAENCECEDCTARAVAAERAKREEPFRESPDAYQLRDFYWVAPIEDNGGMIVTERPEAYKTILMSSWNLVRAKDYASACAAALDARNKLTKGN